MLGDYYDPEARNIRLQQLAQQFDFEQAKVRIVRERELLRLEEAIARRSKPRVTVTRGGPEIYCVVLYSSDRPPALFNVCVEKTYLLLRLSALGCQILNAEEGSHG